MLTNTKSLWIIIIILILLNIVSLGSIWFMKGNKSQSNRRTYDKTEKTYRREHNPNFLSQKLNFTPEQQQLFDTLAIAHKQQLNIKNDEMRELRERLLNRINNQEFDTSSEDLIQKIGQKQAELELLNFRNFRDVMAICNDEQKEKFLAIMHKGFKPRYDRHGKNRRGRDRDKKDRN